MHRTIASLLLACTSLLLPGALPGQAQPAPSVVLLPKGTILEFKNLQAIDQATAQVGDRVPLRLARPLAVDGTTLLAEGEMLYGTVTKVHKKIERCKNSQGWVEWQVDRISLADSSTAKVRVVGTVGAPDPVGGHEVLSLDGRWVAWLNKLENEGLPQESHVWEKIGMGVTFLPALVLLAPMIIAEAPDARSCGNLNMGTTPTPPDTPVVVVITKDHHVRT